MTWSNESIAERVVGTLSDGTPVTRRPVFDIDVRAEKKDPYTRLSHNENMKELYRMGVFDPANAAQAAVLLSSMDFSGVGRVREQVARLAGSRTVSAPHTVAETAAPAKDPLTVATEGAAAMREAAQRAMQ